MFKNAYGKKAVALVVAVVLLIGLLPISASAVTPSGKEYGVSLGNSTDVFIGNKTPVNVKAGDEVYFVYTVDSVSEINIPGLPDAKAASQHGIIATGDNTRRFPYEEGGKFFYRQDGGLLDVGYTYFFKLGVNEAGEFEYTVGKSKDGESSYISFPMEHGAGTDEYNFFGFWFGVGYVTAELSHVMCYDQNGNDLGVKSLGAAVTSSDRMQYDTQVQHAYNVSAVGTINLAISNAKKRSSDVTYMEYTVKSANSRMYQTGVYSTTSPGIDYPHNSGQLYYESFLGNLGNGYLLDVGASYIIRFEHEEKMMTASVQKTKDGKTEVYSFPQVYGNYLDDAEYFGLWFGEGPSYPVSLELINLKCYDDKGNNLGIRSNQPATSVVHFGEHEDYSIAEGLYINRETGDLLALMDDKTAKLTSNGTTSDLSYRIEAGKILLVTDTGKETFDFLFQRIAGENAVYDRLGTYYVTFVDGTDNPPAKQKVDAETGYTAMKPVDPSREDATFEGWVLSDGTAYDFDSVVSESLTLYAKWSDGIAYQAVDGNAAVIEWGPIVGIGASVLLLAAALVIILVLVRKKGGKNNAAN
ncbi:MAG: InlB B-repeat-containing protein [Clostridia bacterium]|nr:InlB B-repeat-containing protein [Clostridia bacterium]